MLIEQILNKFSNYTSKKETDTLAKYNLRFMIDFLPSNNTFFEIKELINEFPKNDIVNFTVHSSDDDYFSITSKKGKVSITGPEYINASNLDATIDKFNQIRIEGNQLEIKIEINKNIESREISIYSINNFMGWLTSKSIYDLIRLFSDLYKNNDILIFKSYDKEIEIITDTLKIVDNKNQEKIYDFDRKKCLKID